MGGDVTTPAWRAALLDQGPETFVAFDADARIVYASPAAGRLLGYPPDQLAGVNVLDLVHPDDAVRAVANIEGLAGGAQPMAGLLRLRHTDGEWVELELRPWTVHLPGPPDGPGTVTAVSVRDNRQNDAHWAFLAALASGAAFGECIRLLADGLSTPIDGPLGISYENRDHRIAVGPVPPLLAGVGPDGLLDTTRGTPWARAVATGEAQWCTVEELPEPFRSEAQAIGAGAAVAVPAPDPGSVAPALLVQWPASPAMGAILAEALRRRPREAMVIALDRRALDRRLERLARQDPLTDVANRTRFFEVLADLVAHGNTYGVLYIDLDHFKPINDAHGHVAGDEVLVHCAQRLRAASREHDLVARFGGDEFVIVCPDVTEDALERVASRVVTALAEPVQVGALLLDVGASVGCALGAAGADPDQVVAAADTALYEAKRGGRGRWRRAPNVGAS